MRILRYNWVMACCLLTMVVGGCNGVAPEARGLRAAGFVKFIPASFTRDGQGIDDLPQLAAQEEFQVGLGVYLIKARYPFVWTPDGMFVRPDVASDDDLRANITTKAIREARRLGKAVKLD